MAKNMRAFLIFILIGLLMAVPGEILNQLLARVNPRAFGATFLSYTVLLFVGYFVTKAIRRGFKKKHHAALATYLLFGTLGLMVEWFLLGNSPVLDPFQVIVQPGMFTFWATLFVAPWLLREGPELLALKTSFVRFFVCLSLLYLAVAILVPKNKGGIYFAFILFAAGYTALNFYYWKYFTKLKNAGK